MIVNSWTPGNNSHFARWDTGSTTPACLDHEGIDGGVMGSETLIKEKIPKIFQRLENVKMSDSETEKTGVDFIIGEIKDRFISKAKYSKLQNEVAALKRELQTAKQNANEVRKLKWELEREKENMKEIKREYDREKLQNDIVRAEKKVAESKYGAMELKLKLKNQQYDELLKKTECNRNQKESSETQTIKMEAVESGEVKVPSMPSSKVGTATGQATGPTSELAPAKAGTKRKQSNSAGDKLRRSKRKAQTKVSESPKKLYNCAECFNEWGKDIEKKFRYFESPTGRYRPIEDKSTAPDPQLKIQTFTNFEDYEKHLIDVHNMWSDPNLTRGKCGIAFFIPYGEPDREWNYTPFGDKVCVVCDVPFEEQTRYDQHFEIEHADLNELTKNELYAIWYKYDQKIYA